MDRSTLSFSDDGTFKILHLTDLHWRNGDATDRRTAGLIRMLIDAEEPDLVAVTGDIITKAVTVDAISMFREALLPISRSGVPWVFTFGNHDLEACHDPRDLVEVLTALPNVVFDSGPPGVAGYSNYAVPIYRRSSAGGDSGFDAASVAAVLYLLDTGAKTSKPFGGATWIQRSQISWYIERSHLYTQGAGGAPLPSLAFFHVPLPEYNEVWDLCTCYGDKLSTVACPKVNSGLFAAFVEQGDVCGVFVGHNHHNDFYGDLHGIRLAYSRVSGFGKGREDYPRGGRVIRLFEGERQFQTWQRVQDGTRVVFPVEHSPEQIDPFGKRNGPPVSPIKRIVDVADSEAVPKRFRVVSALAPRLPGVDMRGFAELRCSGSGQFSLGGLQWIARKINSSRLTIIDLRQESHGFVDGMAISWYGAHNAANIGLSRHSVIEDESGLLAEVRASSIVFFDHLAGKSVDLEDPPRGSFEVLSEQDLVRGCGIGYARFFVTDHHRPDELEIDEFMRFVEELPTGTWLHFHCRGGVGRTSTFMLMYDMIRNSQTVSLSGILHRHVLIGGRDMERIDSEDVYKHDAAIARLEFIGDFYRYCRDTAAWRHADGEVRTWREWIANNRGAHVRTSRQAPSAEGQMTVADSS